MAKVIVYGLSTDDVELLELLEAADCEVVDEELLPDDGLADGKDTPDALVVVLKPELAGDDALEGEVFRVVNRGCRIVGVWPLHATSSTLPDCIGKYSTARVSWNAQKLRSAVCGEGEPVYDSPTGEPRSMPDTDRNVCR